LGWRRRDLLPSAWRHDHRIERAGAGAVFTLTVPTIDGETGDPA